MLWRSHCLAGACTGLLLAGHTDARTAALYVGVAGIGALLPDIDSYKSFIGRKAPVSVAINFIAGHRGVLHSLIAGIAAAGLFFLGMKLKFPVFAGLTVPFFIGYLSHLTLDTFNPSGVPWLWPLPWRLRLPLICTGGFLEKLIIIPALTILFLWLSLSLLGFLPSLRI